MADNVAITAGSGTSIAADDISSVFYQRVKPQIGADGVAADWSSTNPGPIYPIIGSTIVQSVTRPADTTAYTANDAWADSTSSPTTGGFTLTSMARASGGSGVIDSVTITSTNDPATLLQGEIWLFDQAATAVNDNAAFALSDSDVANLVGVIPFTLQTTVAGSGTNSYALVSGVGIGYTCSGSANLRYLIKVKNAYTPASAEVLKVRFAVRWTS